MVSTIVIVVVVLIAALLAYAATRPDTFRIRRSASIKAPPEKIFALIDDFHNWGSWSPYEKLDPAMKRTLSGATSGKGAVYEWEGNAKAGAGRMEIIEAASPSKIAIKLDFTRPFEGHNTAEFTLDAKRNSTEVASTEVTWAMHGPSPFMAKLMGLFINMDKMIGKDFETGLANLRSVTER
jgi:uncharacterized protein YndB with AHSA1/START domain